MSISCVNDITVNGIHNQNNSITILKWYWHDSKIILQWHEHEIKWICDILTSYCTQNNNSMVLEQMVSRIMYEWHWFIWEWH